MKSSIVKKSNRAEEQFGLIEEINPNKFICEGIMYLNSDMTEDAEDKININNLIMKTNFDFKVNKIISEAMDENNVKSLNLRNTEVDEFFKSKEGNVLDLIFFPDNGLRGVNKINLVENSIFYIKIKENLKIGFFINKTMGKCLFGGLNVDKN